jgi:hypothetical protein
MLTPPFATTDDLTGRWRPLSTAEIPRATLLLGDASQLILDEDTHGVLNDLDAPTRTLVRVVCAMVMRAMAPGVVGADEPPVTQASNTFGQFTEQRTYANPTADLYLTAGERRSLRLTRQRAGSTPMWAGGMTEAP